MKGHLGAGGRQGRGTLVWGAGECVLSESGRVLGEVGRVLLLLVSRAPALCSAFLVALERAWNGLCPSVSNLDYSFLCCEDFQVIEFLQKLTFCVTF